MADEVNKEIEVDPNAGNLDRLVDITVPEPVSWWPLAPGWWVVFAILFLGAIAAAVMVIRRWQRDAYRRAALAELDALKVLTIERINEILKRTALCAYPRAEIATLAGPTWSEFLADHGPWKERDGKLLEKEYGAAAEQDEEVELLNVAARGWIEGHRSGGGKSRRRIVEEGRAGAVAGLFLVLALRFGFHVPPPVTTAHQPSSPTLSSLRPFDS